MYIARLLAVLTAGAGFIAVPAHAQEVLPGDPWAGRVFVRENRSDCHDVEREWNELAASYGPAFVDVAAAPGTTAIRLRVFLRSSHIEMPNFILTEHEVDDVISYILTLRPGGGVGARRRARSGPARIQQSAGCSPARS